MSARPPNCLLLITDQQRRPRHWPDEPGWLRSLMPNDAELARTGLSFKNAFCNTAMCSPSRATLLTGRYPAEHGVGLTLTGAALRPDPRNTPSVAAAMAGILRRREARRVARSRSSPAAPCVSARAPATSPSCRRGSPGSGSCSATPATRSPTRGNGISPIPREARDRCSAAGAPPTRSACGHFGFADWEPPDAGENAKAEHFGGGNAADGEGWDEVYTRQIERWLSAPELPEPFCLVASLVNPHDVLGYPASHVAGGYSTATFASSASNCRRRSTRACAASRRCTR